MASLTLKNASGKDAGSVDLDDAIFGIEPNVPLMHQVVTAQLAARPRLAPRCVVAVASRTPRREPVTPVRAQSVHRSSLVVALRWPPSPAATARRHRRR